MGLSKPPAISLSQDTDILPRVYVQQRPKYCNLANGDIAVLPYSLGGNTRRKVGPWGIWDPHSGEMGGRGGSAMAPFVGAILVSYKLSIVSIALFLAIRPQFVIDSLQRWNQYEVGQFGTKFGNEVVDWCKPNFNTIWERHGTVACKRNYVDIFRRLSTMHKRDWQTHTQTTECQVMPSD